MAVATHRTRSFAAFLSNGQGLIISQKVVNEIKNGVFYVRKLAFSMVLMWYKPVQPFTCSDGKH